MASQIDIYVDPNASGANSGSSWTDAYTSLSTAVSSEEKDLVTADEFQIFHCRANSLDDDDNGGVIVDGRVTDATRYVQIQCDNTDRSNKWDRTGSKQYRLLFNAHWEKLYLNDDDVRVLDIQIDHCCSTAGDCIDPSGVASTLTIAYNWIKAGNYANTCEGIAAGNRNSLSKIYNNIIFNVKSAVGLVFTDTLYGTHYVYNNTVILSNDADINTIGIGRISNFWVSNLHCKNNLVQDASGNGKCFSFSDFVFGSWGAGRYDYNLSEDTTADDEIVANNIINTSVTFVNEGGNDYHLNSSEDGNYEGSNESSIFTDDTDGDTRSDWDIGADEIMFTALSRLVIMVDTKEL